MKAKNNVQVSGLVESERAISDQVTRLDVAIISENHTLYVTANILTEQWESFKDEFPDRCNSVTISGLLEAEKSDGMFHYIIRANHVNCFDDSLDGLNESQFLFTGVVELKEKFDFNPSSKLLLKRLRFETVEHSTRFEAVALRSIASRFDTINEGDRLFVKAIYVVDKKFGYPPYWKISTSPKVLAKSA